MIVSAFNVNEVYDELIAATAQVHDLEFSVAGYRQTIIDEHFEEIKSARSIETRNQTINMFLKDDREYFEMADNLAESRKRLVIAQLEVDRLKMLVSIGAG